MASTARNLLPATLAAVLCLASVGCGGRGLYPVEGVVQFDDGSPARVLKGGTVSLESVARRSNAAGEIQADGTFRVQGPTGQDGVPPGSYRVLVLPPESADRRRPPIDPIFGRYETSGIEVTVKEQANKISVVVRQSQAGKKS